MRIIAVGVCFFFAIPVLAGDKIFEWVDANGVRHYANNPPTGTTDYVERDMQPRLHTDGSPSDNYKLGEDDKTAHLTVATQEFERSGPTEHKVRGTVLNDGTGTALNSRVRITVKDPTQGTECLTSDATVDPATIEADGTGKFEVTIQNPCLVAEPPSIELLAVWNADDADQTEMTGAGGAEKPAGATQPTPEVSLPEDANDAGNEDTEDTESETENESADEGERETGEEPAAEVGADTGVEAGADTGSETTPE